MIATVTSEMHSPMTQSRGWPRRRLQKMVKSVFTCLAYTDPTGMFDVHIVTSLDQSFVFGIGTYNLDLLVEMPQEKIDRFIWFAKEVKYFHTVTLTPYPEPVTMPT